MATDDFVFEDKYPESTRMNNVRKQSQIIGEYLNWADGMDEVLQHLSIEEKLAKYYEIDLVQVEKERRQMMEGLRNDCTTL